MRSHKDIYPPEMELKFEEYQGFSQKKIFLKKSVYESKKIIMRRKILIILYNDLL